MGKFGSRRKLASSYCFSMQKGHHHSLEPWQYRPRFWTRHTGENTGPEVAQATVTSPEAFVNFKAEDMVNSLGRHLAEHWCGCFRSCFWGDFEEVLMLLMSLLAGDAG